jgi:hypothetical protein
MTAPTEFQQIATAVSAGTLTMDAERASRILRLIDDQIDKLITLRLKGRRLVYLDDFGTGSARELGEKFHDLATSPTTPGSWVWACQQRIDLMQRLRAVFADTIKATEATDQQLADSLRRVGVSAPHVVKGS